MNDRYPTSNLWSKTAGEPVHAFELSTDMTADVVIIGGGFTGLSAALHLRKLGASVCLLEKETVGFGGSGRNVGLVNAGLWVPPDDVEGQLGQSAGQKLNAILAAGPKLVFDLIDEFQISCNDVRQGTLHCAHSKSGLKDLQNRLRQQIARNSPVILINAAETAERTGSSIFHGALWDERAGTIQPLAFARGLARAAIDKGAEVFEKSPVISITNADETWLVKTKNGTITSGHLINATNAYGAGPAEGSNYTAVNYFQVATKPLPDNLRKSILPNGEGCWDTATVMSSFRTDSTGRLLVGGIGNLESYGSVIHRTWARRKLRRLFPELPEIEFDYAWSGRIAMTDDHLPTVQEIGKNAVSIYGYNGRGISPGSVFGKAASEWVNTGNADAFPVSIKTPGRKSKLHGAKALYYETGAALVHVISARL